MQGILQKLRKKGLLVENTGIGHSNFEQARMFASRMNHSRQSYFSIVKSKSKGIAKQGC